ncbi:MAG: hypothetical protein MK185_15600 [Saccharospirillaceae bacterium]|nr:hypothetical protein [Saccharospirillaceae bacterium]
MKEITIFILLSLFSMFTLAGNTPCSGTVTTVLDYPKKCDGNTAFKITGTNGKWICPASEKGNAIVLSALVAQKKLHVYINNRDSSIDCTTFPDYYPASYILIFP